MHQNRSIICPNCGALHEPSQLSEIHCDYCGSNFENPKNVEKDEPVIDKIIPFDSSSEDVRRKLFEKFIRNEKIPTDIFDKLKIISIEQFYFPVYQITGDYKADWSCTVIYHHKDRQGNEYDEHRPANGVVTGYFSKFTLAINNQNLPKWLRASVDVVDSDRYESKIVDFSSKHLVSETGNDIQVIDKDLSEDEVWNKNSLERTIFHDARNAALAQTSDWKIEDFDANSEYSGSVGDLLLFPVWYLRYSYDGQDYFFVTDGIGINSGSTYPKDFKGDVRQWGIFGRFFLAAIILVVGLSLMGAPDDGFFLTFIIVGAIFLIYRYAKELAKTTEDLKVAKQVGRAKFLNEEIPNVSSNYNSYKRDNKILTWCFVLIVLFFGGANFAIKRNIIYKNEERVEKLYEMNKKGVESIMPNIIFQSSNNEIGHFRQDLKKKIIEVGFVEDSSCPNTECVFGGERYSLSYNGEKFASVFFNTSVYNYPSVEYGNPKDEIYDFTIKIYDKAERVPFLNKFEPGLEQMGFEDKEKMTNQIEGVNLLSLRHGKAYIRIGKIEEPKDDFLYTYLNKRQANWDGVVIDSVLNELKIVCYSKQGIE